MEPPNGPPMGLSGNMGLLEKKTDKIADTSGIDDHKRVDSVSDFNESKKEKRKLKKRHTVSVGTEIAHYENHESKEHRKSVQFNAASFVKHNIQPGSPSKSPKKSSIVPSSVEALKASAAAKEQQIYPTKAVVLEQCVEFDKWVKLRANCMEKLHTFVAAILAVDEKRRGNICLKQMMWLLQMHRNIIFHLVTLFRQFDLRWKCQGEMCQPKQDMLLYVISLSASLDFVNVDPFVDWVGVDLRMNPFVITTCIDGTTAEVEGLSLHENLCDPELEQECAALGKILYQYVAGTSVYTPRERRRLVTTEDRPDADSDNETEDKYVETGIIRVKKIVLYQWLKNWTKSLVLERKWVAFRTSVHHRNKRLVRSGSCNNN
jgi:hypothetical protein